MAAAVSTCNSISSVLSSTIKFSYSISSQSCFVTSQRPIASVSPRTVSHKCRAAYTDGGSPSSKSNPNREKDAVAPKKYQGRLKDERPALYADKGSGRKDVVRPQPTSYKSFGVPRKDKEFLFDSKEQQVEPSNIQNAAFLNAVVKVYCTHTAPDYSLPWQKQRQYTSTGSAFMIEGGKLLTNAHCVEHDTQVKVKRRGDDTKYVAKWKVKDFGEKQNLLSLDVCHTFRMPLLLWGIPLGETQFQ